MKNMGSAVTPQPQARNGGLEILDFIPKHRRVVVISTVRVDSS